MRELCPRRTRSVSLCEALDRVLNTGVVALGEVKLSVANVDLIYLGLQLVVTSIESGGQSSPAILPCRNSTRMPRAGPQREPIEVRPRGQPETRPSADVLPVAPGGRPDSQSSHASGENTEFIGNAIARPGCKPEKNGLGQLVLTRLSFSTNSSNARPSAASKAALAPAQIERLGVTLMNQAREIDHLRDNLGLMDKGLNLDLGPLGKLL